MTPSPWWSRPRGPPSWPSSPRPRTSSDAHAHHKFVGYTSGAEELFAAAGVAELDVAYVDLAKRGAAKRFVETCRALRFWDRTP
jgi:hypothetical protein